MFSSSFLASNGARCCHDGLHLGRGEKSGELVQKCVYQVIMCYYKGLTPASKVKRVSLYLHFPQLSTTRSQEALHFCPPRPSGAQANTITLAIIITRANTITQANSITQAKTITWAITIT